MNINEIARLAGVSRATVSRYLNNGYVSSEKKGSHPQGDPGDRISAILPGTDNCGPKKPVSSVSSSKDQFRYHKP